MSTLTSFDFIGERSEATPGLFNRIYSQLSDNIRTVDQFQSAVTGSITSNLSIGVDLWVQGMARVGSPVASSATRVGLSLVTSSALANYIQFEDSSAAKSSYILGSRVGSTGDGLNLWDDSGQTMIVSFSKQSVRFIQPAVGAFYDQGGIIANIKAYGAVGDGVADDTTLIQDALNATVGGGIVAFPGGTYRVTSTLSAGARQILRGQGWNSILSSQFSGPLIKVNANTTDPPVGAAVMAGLADGFVLEDMVLYSTSTQSSIGLSIVSYSPNPAKTVRIAGTRNVRIQGFDVGTSLIDTQGVAFYLTQFLGNRIGLWAHDNSQLGLLGQCDFRANTLYGTWLSSTSQVIGVVADRIYGWVFDRCHWELNTGKGVVFDGATFNTLIGCKLEGNADSFSHFTDTAGFRPDGNTFIGCTWNGNASVTTVLQVDMPVGHGNLFLNNQFNVGQASGLSFGPNTADNMLWGCVIPGGSSYLTYLTDRSNSSSNVYYLPAHSYVRLQGSAASIEWMSPSLHTGGNVSIPAIAFLSEQSLGIWRSAASTIATSYGTFDLSRSSLNGPITITASDIAITAGQRIRMAGMGSNVGFGINTGEDGAAIDVAGSASAITGLILRPNLNLIHFGKSESSAYLGALNKPTVLEASTEIGGTGTVTLPAFGYASENSLGWYRSGVSTMALSYGTLNLATQAVRLSMRTLAASAVTVSAAKTNVAVDEVVFTIGGASGASLIIHSGGTAYGFNSAFSAATS